MIVIGLTGSMAMGKSTASEMLRAMKGIAVHCSDDAVRALYGNPDVSAHLKNAFPQAWDSKKGAIDKTALIKHLGRDHEKWNALEAILHPYVQESQQKFLREQRTLGTKIAVLDIPLLFETGAQNRVDYTICVSAPDFIQKQRIDQRIAAGLLTPEDAAFRLARQMPDGQKKALADFTVQAGQGMEPMRRELEKIIRDLKEKHFQNENGKGAPSGCRPS